MREPRLYEVVTPGPAGRVDAALFDPHDPAPKLAGEPSFGQLIQPTRHREDR